MSQQKTLIQLGLLGCLTIAGMIIMMHTSQKIDAQLTLIEIMRAQAPLKTEFNPCQEVKCGPGQKAAFIGEDNSARIELYPYGGNKVCKCPDGRIIKTRAYHPKRFA